MRFIAGVAASAALALSVVSPAAAGTNSSAIGESSVRASYGDYKGGYRGCAHYDGVKARASVSGRANIHVPDYTVTRGRIETGWRWEYEMPSQPGGGDWSVWITHGQGRVNLTNTRTWCVRFAH